MHGCDVSISPAPKLLDGFPYIKAGTFTCEQINYLTCFAVGKVLGSKGFAIGQGDILGGVKESAGVASITREGAFVFAGVMFIPPFEFTADQLASIEIPPSCK